MTAIYHITHIDNIPSIFAKNGLCCENLLAVQDLAPTVIGYSDLKARRATTQVRNTLGGTLSEYVPFYFAPRSPMLYTISRGGVSGYTGTQRQIIHLVTSAELVENAGLDYVFTDGHAVMVLSNFYSDLTYLDQIDWAVMRSTYWNDTKEDGDRKRRRNAEFLVKHFLPWSLIQSIGVKDRGMATALEDLLGANGDKPRITISPEWYY